MPVRRVAWTGRRDGQAGARSISYCTQEHISVACMATCMHMVYYYYNHRWRLSRLLSLSDLVCDKTQTSDADAGGRMDASASGRWYPKALDPPRSDEECIDYYRILCSNSVKKFARCSDFTCPTISRTGHVVLPVPRNTLTSDLACAWTRWCKHFHPGI